MESLTRSLVRLIRERPVSRADLQAGERYVRDWLGSWAAGASTEPGRILEACGQGDSDLEARVFLAAARSHVTETDDLHRASVTHPGCVVVPTALLLARRHSASGARALRAVLAGYEAMLRVGEALGPGHYRIFHNTATAGVFGAAAAACDLLDLGEEQWVWALGNAGTQAAGLWQFNEDATMSKHLHAGHAAAAGLRAARLAGAGFTGPARILEGDRGFFRGFCPDPEPEAVLRGADSWKLHETSLKPYPCCRHTHATIDGALELRSHLGGRWQDIESVRVETYPAALDVTDRPRPDSSYAAKFSLQYCLGRTLIDGAPGLESFHPERLRDPALQALLPRIEVGVDARLTALYPDQWGARVTIETGSGGRLEAQRDGPLGDPERPLEDQALDEKVRGLMVFGGMDPGTSDALIRAVKRLPDATTVPPLPTKDGWAAPDAP